MDALYPLIVPEVMGCPSITIDSAIIRAAAEFCEKSTAWREQLPDITLVDGTAEYTLTLPAGSRLVVIREREAKLNGKPLSSVQNAAQISPEYVGIPSHYAQRGFDSVILSPTPSNATGQVLSIYAVLAPTLTATSLPAVLIDRFYEAISEGAKAILKRMPNQPWSDAARAADHYQLFKQKTAEARIQQEHGLVAGNLSVRPRAFGGVRKPYPREML